jgi:acetyl-CoA carboxylase, biotin carboxylase subunit
VKPFQKVLVANRGEIAVRVIRACRDLGLRSVAIYSDVDRAALHVSLADEAWPVGEAPARESYLDMGKVLEAARRSGAGAIHPGYGFLSENAAFARACEDAGLVFIGPRSETIALLGEKTSARRVAVEAGVPVVPGTLSAVATPEDARREAEKIGLPVMLKAAAGGGGKGLRLVREAGELLAACERASSEALSAFGDGSVYVEKALIRPRHVEMQVLADGQGGVVHLFERECSVQRRHQKVVEETPSPAVTPALRRRMGDLAVALARRAGYRNAGTFEFLVDAAGEPYFLEANTRLQVEHPITEMVVGVDLVQLQLRIAQGERLPFVQDDLAQRGHAIECRVYAEDPDRGFLPSPGRITALRTPSGPGIRDDGGVYGGWEVPVHYDSLISKLIAHGADRTQALARMRRAVSEYVVLGIHTTLPFFARLFENEEFVSGRYDTGLVERMMSAPAPRDEKVEELAAVVAAVRAHRDRRARLAGAPAAAAQNAWRQAGLREGTGGLR